MSMDLYNVIRLRTRTAKRTTIATGLTLEQAKDHCSREDTHGGAYCWDCDHRQPSRKGPWDKCPKCGSTNTSREWFDGFEKR